MFCRAAQRTTYNAAFVDSPSASMKLYSWNVNGIRAVLKKGTFQSFVTEHRPDVLCLQETKADREQVAFDLAGYHEYWHSAKKKGYSGTAIFSKRSRTGASGRVPVRARVPSGSTPSSPPKRGSAPVGHGGG